MPLKWGEKKARGTFHFVPSGFSAVVAAAAANVAVVAVILLRQFHRVPLSNEKHTCS